MKEKYVVISSPQSFARAVRSLTKADKKLGKIIEKVGKLSLVPDHKEDLVTAFTSAIVSQQLSTKVARTILGRVHELVLKNGQVCPIAIAETSDEALRGAGLSRMKLSYVRDLAAHAVGGKLPTYETLSQMSNEAIIDELTKVRGIGKWTVEMFLMFNLARADVFPVLDFGIRKALSRLYKLPEVMTVKEAAAYGEEWKPYRTVACMYLWRSLDLKDETASREKN